MRIQYAGQSQFAGPIRFAGQKDYECQLGLLRKRMAPLQADLRNEYEAVMQARKLAQAQQKKRTLEAAPAHTPFLGIKKGWANLKWISAATGSKKKAIGAKANQVVTAIEAKTESAGSAVRKNQRHDLYAVVLRLREESNPNKAQWLQSFEQKNSPLTPVERYVMREWTF